MWGHDAHVPDLACLGIGAALLALGVWAALLTGRWRHTDRELVELRAELRGHRHPHNHAHTHGTGPGGPGTGPVLVGDPATVELRTAMRGGRRPRPRPPGDPQR